MSMSSKSGLLSFASMAALFVCASCVNIAYDGDSKDPKAKRSEVKIFMDKSKIPVADYKVLGTATISAPTSYTAAEVEMKLVDFAKARGADGLLILSVDRVANGVLRADQALSVTPSSEAQAEESTKVTMKAMLLEFPKADDDALLSSRFKVSAAPEAKGKDVKDAAPKAKVEPIPVD